MKRTFILMGLLGSLTAVPQARGQSIGPSTLNATGGSATIGSNNFEWSVGEMTMVSTFTAPGIVVTQGVLQPDDNTTGVVNANALNDKVHVFPVPTSAVLNVQYSFATKGTLSCRLTDAAGKAILTRTVSVSPGNDQQQLNIATLPAANYMLEVTYKTDDAKEQQTTFKVQKLN